MKFTLIILTVLAPFFAHAGGGGGLRPGMEAMTMQNPEYVFNLGENNGVVQFAMGNTKARNGMSKSFHWPSTNYNLIHLLFLRLNRRKN